MRDAIYFPGLVPTTFAAVSAFVTENPYARQRFAVASEVLGYELVDAYATAEVYDWEVYEAGFMAMTLALADWTVDNLDLDVVLTGGQSYGAIIAAVFTGTLDYRDAVRLVRDSVVVETDFFSKQERPLGCFFFYRLDSATVDRLVAESVAAGAPLEVSIYLDNSVHAVSGPLADLEVFEQRVRAAGGFPFYMMNRSEHCSAVAGLRDRLEKEVYSAFDWRPARVPLLSDVTGELLSDPDKIMTDLLDGWVTPVHWSTVIGGFRSAGTENVYIVGPRNMFARITNAQLPTAVVTPKTVAEFPVKGLRPHVR